MNTKKSSYTISPNRLSPSTDKALTLFSKEQVLERLWNQDFTLWNETGDEISNRLGWLNIFQTIQQHLDEIFQLVDNLRAENYESVILLGMGGSSLAPDVFQKVFSERSGFLKLRILDSTDPNAILTAQEGLNLKKTLFIVSTKSGGTVETLSFFKYFYNLLAELVGNHEVGRHFVAITDPDSSLAILGYQLQFRKIFLNDPNIGGRYSALSFFGLVPAALIGIDLNEILEQAAIAADANGPGVDPANSFAAKLGALLGIGVLNGVDKLTFLAEESISSFSNWVEQLVAESTGKSGTGILPVVGEELPDDLENYSRDRIFVLHHFNGNVEFENLASKLLMIGHPVIQFRLEHSTQIGALILIWEIASVLASHLLSINPFDQPNVESAKILARESVSAYQHTGALPIYPTEVFTPQIMEKFLCQLQPGDYVALQAFVNPSVSSEIAFRKFQASIRDKYKVATTFGFGPRFLHSTGQLHKGDAGKGYFLQFTSSSEIDFDIPTQAGYPESFITFNVLKIAQAIGDANALTQENRKVITFSMNEPLADSINDFLTRFK